MSRLSTLFTFATNPDHADHTVFLMEKPTEAIASNAQETLVYIIMTPDRRWHGRAFIPLDDFKHILEYLCPDLPPLK